MGHTADLPGICRYWCNHHNTVQWGRSSSCKHCCKHSLLGRRNSALHYPKSEFLDIDSFLWLDRRSTQDGNCKCKSSSRELLCHWGTPNHMHNYTFPYSAQRVDHTAYHRRTHTCHNQGDSHQGMFLVHTHTYTSCHSEHKGSHTAYRRCTCISHNQADSQRDTFSVHMCTDIPSCPIHNCPRTACCRCTDSYHSQVAVGRKSEVQMYS